MPQLFQQQELGLNAQMHALQRMSSLNPAGAGVLRAQVDEAALAINRLSLADVAVYFADGTWYDAVKMHYLPPSRDLSDVANQGEPLQVYLCLPELNTVGNNLSDADQHEPRRYLKTFAEVTDLYGQHRTEMASQTLNLSLKFAFEQREQLLSLPIGQLQRNQHGQWEWLTEYVPPIVYLNSSPYLLALLRRQVEVLLAKSHSLSMQRRERNQQSADFLVSDISLFWLLNTINQALPQLQFFLRHPEQSPADYYVALSRLIGGLMAFALDKKLSDMAPYLPEDLSHTFTTLDQLLRTLLDTVIPTALVVVDLEQQGTTRWLGHLYDDRLDQRADYYLSVRSSAPLYELQSQFQKLCKVGSPDEVQQILPSASNGIPLRLMQRLPSALPMRSEAVYFALDAADPAFARMLAARSCCIYMPQVLSDLAIELYAVPHE
ncbi:MAG: type VI secretion system baseplate subunit TssK [Neisseriaceae bacterium]|nr:type VI secretion system baseplate subunit TssK [Neisseriaceae bacterium]MBP6863593.1 type VI secretion system baseplate subunit TssK [Neisseriaceae bacterium]